jgi:hypothetical protein
MVEQNRNCGVAYQGRPMSRTDTKRRAKSTSHPDGGRQVAPFGPPPLIEGEDTQAYDEILTQISSAVKPADILEDIWVRDIVDLVWEALRLRRLKANLMTVTAVHGLAELLEPLMGESEAADLATDWAMRRPRAIKKVDSILASLGLTKDALWPRPCPSSSTTSNASIA